MGGAVSTSSGPTMSYAQQQSAAIALAMSTDKDRDRDRDFCYRALFQADLSKFILQQRIGSGRFMKSYIMRVDSVPVVVKVYMHMQLRLANSTAVNIPPSSNVQSSNFTGTDFYSTPPPPPYSGSIGDERSMLKYFALQLSKQFRTLSPAKYPNLMPYQIWIHPASNSATNVVPASSSATTGYNGVMGSGSNKGIIRC